MFGSIAQSVRFAQPLAQSEHRSFLANLHDAGRGSRAGCARCSTAAPARPTWRWRTTAPAEVIRRSSEPISAARCSSLGHAKVKKAGAAGRITLVEGDTQRLPVPSDTFGVVSVAFGLRNVRDTVRGVDEMIRVARPGGKVAILEFSRPRGRLLGPALPGVLSPFAAARRPGAGTQPGRRVRLFAPERPRVPGRPGDARSPGRARTDRAQAVSPDRRNRHALCRHQITVGTGRQE